MATHLNLEEQEQIDQLKHFWKTYGVWITAVVVLALLTYSGWTGYRYWQASQNAKSAVIADQVQTAAQSLACAAVQRALDDVRQQFASTDYAQQASLAAAQAYQADGKVAEARAALEWLAASGANAGYQAIAKLRLASLSIEAKDYDAALKQLAGELPAEFAGLAADKRGDALLAQGKRDEARAAYEQAYKAMDPQADYRNLVEVKLNALGVDVAGLAS